MSDRQVADTVLAGNRDGFRLFVERESAAVIATCRRVLRDPEEAQDAAQDAFTQAYRSLATYRGDGPFGAWVRQIAVRVSIARLSARHEIARLDGETIDPRAAALRSSSDPEGHAIDREYRSDVLVAINSLPASQRDVVVLRFYGDLTLDEISRVTSHPIGTVKSRLSRGMNSLREQLASRSGP
jgi:RNA polymerase sigma-70 factor (ECF subfamily)